MLQLSSRMAQVSEARMPSLCSGRCTLKPGVLVGTMKAERPFLPSSGSVTANTRATCARLPPVANCVAPLSDHFTFLSVRVVSSQQDDVASAPARRQGGVEHDRTRR